MYKLSYRAWGGALPLEMPKVFFTCFPDDFDSTFDSICDDIFRTHRCAVYYTVDMSSEIPSEQRLTDLDGMNLFVIPVTKALLTVPNRAMDIDLPYAMEKRIPVLPIMLDTGLDPIYSREDRFGKLHYLSPSDTSELGLGYSEKLKRYLESIFVVDDVKDKIEKAFDARMFMSYRRDDRLTAMNFMSIFHRIPRFRDIAIWYDEFLIPGEDYAEALRNKIQQCDLFTLIITPKLVENMNNYVLNVEYPDARKAGKPVLYAEMLPTDPEAILKIDELNDTLDPHDNSALEQRVAELVSSQSIGEHLDDPSRQFLMGSAYMVGFHVEVDRERAVQLLLSSAEAGNPNAQSKVSEMYRLGQGVSLDYSQEVYWAERYAENCKTIFGEHNEKTYEAYCILAQSYHHAGRYGDELAQWEALYEQQLQISGKDDMKVRLLQINIASCCDALGFFKRALEISKDALSYFSAIFDKHNRVIINLQGNIANILFDLSETQQAIELSEDVCKSAQTVLGNEDPMTLDFLNNHACFLIEFGALDEAERILNNIYSVRARALGIEHPKVLDVIHNFALLAKKKHDYSTSLSYEKQAYEMRQRILGNDHPHTQRSLSSFIASCRIVPNGYREIEELLHTLEKAYESEHNIKGATAMSTIYAAKNLAKAYIFFQQYQRALDLLESVHKKCITELGRSNDETIRLGFMLGKCYLDIGKHNQALNLVEKYNQIRNQEPREFNQEILNDLIALAATYERSGYRLKAFNTDKIAYQLSKEAFGENHPDTLAAQLHLACGYACMNNYSQALTLCKQVYEKQCKLLGDTHSDTLFSMSRLSRFLAFNGLFYDALELGERAYNLMGRFYGKKDPKTLWALLNVAHCQVKLRQYDSAIKYSNLAYQYYSEVFSEQHPNALEALEIIAEVYRKTGNPQKALELDINIHSSFIKIYNRQDHPAIIEALINMVLDYIELGDGNESLKHSQLAFNLARQSEGTADNKTLYTVMLMAVSFSLLGNYEKAIKLFNQYLEGIIDLYGKKDLQSLIALYDVALFSRNHMNDLSYAVLNAEKAYMIGRQVLGEVHLFVNDAWDLLRTIRSQQFGEHPEWHCVMDAIRSVKKSRHYDRLLINHEGVKAANQAVSSYAPKADLFMGFAVQQFGFRFLGLGKIRGILLTETTLYSDQLPPEGIPYKEIRNVKSVDGTMCISLYDTRELKLVLDSYSDDVSAVLQAACIANLLLIK